jgi:hypothetical protein
MAFTPADEILAVLKKQLGLNSDIDIIIQAWERELGPLTSSVTLVAINKSTLIVEVASSVHLQEMLFRKRQLINRLNQYLGNKKAVKEIKFSLKK